MEGFSWKCLALIVLALCHMVLTVPVPQNELGEPLSPVNGEDNLNVDDVERPKRKLPEATFGAKNAILGYVFGEEDIDSGPVLHRPTRATPVLPPGTTDDTPDFSRQMVSLEIPDQLFGSSFSMATTISKIFGDLILSTARRYSQFMQLFKPLLGKSLYIKGLYAPPSTTTTTTTESNEV